MTLAEFISICANAENIDTVNELAEHFNDVSCSNCKHCTTYNSIDSCPFYYDCDTYGELNYFEPKDL